MDPVAGSGLLIRGILLPRFFFLLPTAAVLFIVLLSLWEYWIRRIFRPFPRGYKTAAKNRTICDDIKSGCGQSKSKPNRQRYDYDAICIGSGIGNLTAAALLSLCGWKVLVLERHYAAGGATHTFQTKHGEHEVGVHYVGSPPSGLLSLLTGCNRESEKHSGKQKNRKIQFQPMDEPNKKDNPNGSYVYDKVIIGDRVIDFRAGVENLKRELMRHFPTECDTAAIDKYFHLVKDASHHNGFYICKFIRPLMFRRVVQWAYTTFINPNLLKYQTHTTWETLTRHLGDGVSPELLNVLCSRFGQIGPSPFADTFSSHACVVNHFLNGGYYPLGGSSVFVDNISPTIVDSGGSIKVRKHVEKIIINSELKQVEGVKLHDGKYITSSVVLSGAGIRNTYKYLIPQDIASNLGFPLEKMEKDIGISVKFIFCFFDLEGTSQELELPSSNLWELPLSSPDANLHDFLQSFLQSQVDDSISMPLFISSVSAKDPSYEHRHPGKSAAVVITYSKMEDFLEWGHMDQRVRRKSSSYNAMKETYRQVLTEKLHRHFPKTRGRVLHSEVATPLTTKTFLNAPDGEFRGLDETVAKASYQRFFEPETPVRGLYLCGQELTMLGVFSALHAGVLAASAVLQYGTWTDLIFCRNIVDDLKRFAQYQRHKRQNKTHNVVDKATKRTANMKDTVQTAAKEGQAHSLLNPPFTWWFGKKLESCATHKSKGRVQNYAHLFVLFAVQFCLFVYFDIPSTVQGFEVFERFRAMHC